MHLLCLGLLVLAASTTCYGQSARPSACSLASLERCGPGEQYPALSRLFASRGPDDFKSIIRQTNPQALCNDTRGFLNCVKSGVQSLPSEGCGPRVDDIKTIGLPALDEVLDLVDAVCANDLDAIRDNLECYLDFDERKKEADVCIEEFFEAVATQALPGGHNECTLYSAIPECMIQKLATAPGCGPEASETASRSLGRLALIQEHVCNQIIARQADRRDDSHDYDDYSHQSLLKMMKFF